MGVPFNLWESRVVLLCQCNRLLLPITVGRPVISSPHQRRTLDTAEGYSARDGA